MPRDITRQSPLGALGRRDFIIDEADDSYDAFPAARALGYRGISSKSCKGIYKSIVNATRAAKWSAGGGRVLHQRRRPDLPGRPCRAAGSCAGRADRRHPCRAQRPSLCRRLCATRRPPRREAFLSAHPDLYTSERRQGPARDPRRRSADGIADGTGFCHVGPSGLVHACRRWRGQPQKFCRSTKHDHKASRPDHERRHRPDGA